MVTLYMDQFQWKRWPVTLGVTAKGLSILEFRPLEEVSAREKKGNKELDTRVDTAVAEPFKCQLIEYFNGERKEFDMPLDLSGTPFQLRVWAFLQSIPYGQVASYQEAATAAGNSKAVRAAGMANNRNPVSVVVPCHRVVGKDGSLVGYGGGLKLKETLLNLEGIQVHQGRIREDSAWKKNQPLP